MRCYLVPLARTAAAAGAEWSLFCPAIGIAADSSAAVIALLLRTAAAAGLGTAVAGVGTASADGTDVGTDVLPEAGAAEPVWAVAESTWGTGGASRSLPQATRVMAARQQAATVRCFGIEFSSRKGFKTAGITSLFAPARKLIPRDGDLRSGRSASG